LLLGTLASLRAGAFMCRLFVCRRACVESCLHDELAYRRVCLRVYLRAGLQACKHSFVQVGLHSSVLACRRTWLHASMAADVCLREGMLACMRASVHAFLSKSVVAWRPPWVHVLFYACVHASFRVGIHAIRHSCVKVWLRALVLAGKSYCVDTCLHEGVLAFIRTCLHA
jgi:hypothetical protein